MKLNNYKPQLPDVMEAIFDVAYLIFDFVAAILFFIYSITSDFINLTPFINFIINKIELKIKL